ncbi:hypothetical protein [Streptomyces coeruleorubidus]|uniref:hypothetical protein n=1 Tax=Streptomyces coeruleorubidus TaxID=116188 RepID=UPI003F52F77F
MQTGPGALVFSTAGRPAAEERQVDVLPGGNDPLPMRLWSSAPGLRGEDVDVR